MTIRGFIRESSKFNFSIRFPWITEYLPNYIPYWWSKANSSPHYAYFDAKIYRERRDNTYSRDNITT